MLSLNFFNVPATTKIYTLSYTTLFRSVPQAGARPAAGRRGRTGDRDPDHRAARAAGGDRKSTRLNSSHVEISYAVFCLKKKKLKQLTLPFGGKLVLQYVLSRLILVSHT